jgi:hypothetical protein
MNKLVEKHGFGQFSLFLAKFKAIMTRLQRKRRNKIVTILFNKITIIR